jgi:hypothetical protein
MLLEVPVCDGVYPLLLGLWWEWVPGSNCLPHGLEAKGEEKEAGVLQSSLGQALSDQRASHRPLLLWSTTPSNSATLGTQPLGNIQHSNTSGFFLG